MPKLTRKIRKRVANIAAELPKIGLSKLELSRVVRTSATTASQPEAEPAARRDDAPDPAPAVAVNRATTPDSEHLQPVQTTVLLDVVECAVAAALEPGDTVVARVVRTVPQPEREITIVMTSRGRKVTVDGACITLSGGLPPDKSTLRWERGAWR